MAAQKVVVKGSSGVAAAQLKDLFRQIADGSLTGDHLQAFLERRNPFVIQGAVGVHTTHLRHLQSVTLAATSGTATITQSGDVFGYIDPDFAGWGTDQPGVDTPEAPVDVYEQTKNGNFPQLFMSLPDDLRSLCLTQGQIVEFCREHREQLRQDGYATLFLFEAGGELFVAIVNVFDGQLRVLVLRFECDGVWNADRRHRVVVR